MIALFARHATAPNLLLIGMVLFGLLALTRMNKQFFPDFGIDVIVVSVAWPGAGAEDVDNGIIQLIEPEVRFLAGVADVIAVSREGSASLQLDFEAGTDMQSALSDVEAAVSRITNLPEASETPRIRRIVRRADLLRISISGDVQERTLKTWAKRMRDGLLRAGVDEVELIGARDEWILVEAHQRDLLALDLPIQDISRRIAEVSRDIPGGMIGRDTVSRVRSLGLGRTAEEVSAVEVRAFPDGRRLTVGDVATVRESWDERQPRVWVDRRPAIELIVKRAPAADALETAAAAREFLDDFVPTLPAGISVERYDETSELIDERIDLLVKNGLGGLVIVLLVLFAFLETRIALWVAAGIPAALLAAMGLAWMLGQSINMLMLFGTILAIGMIVDEAIVVAEYADSRRQQGDTPLQAALKGAERMAGPIFSTTLTTVAAFLPLVMIGGIIGQIVRDIPIIVVLALLASLVECFLVLPGHLYHSFAAPEPSSGRRLARWRRRSVLFHQQFQRRFEKFRHGWFRRMVARALDHRYLVLATGVGLLVISIGIAASGRIGFTFFPSVEPDKVFATVAMIPGTAREETRERLFEIEQAARSAARALGAPGIIRHATVVAGAGPRVPGLGPTGDADTVGTVTLYLTAPDRREVRTDDFARAWREHAGSPIGVDTLSIRTPQAGPPGREIDVRLSGDSLRELDAAAGRVKALLASYPGVSAIEDNLTPGPREMRLRVSPAGRALGFDTTRAGMQMRGTLEGETALRFARGDEEVEVRVRLSDPPDGLDSLYLFGPGGTEVPLTTLAEVTTSGSHDVIRRERGRRQVAVTADVDETVTTSSRVLAALVRDGLARTATDAGLEWRFAGRAEEEEETFADMGVGAAVGLVGMFLVLAWIFGSYTRPLAVMAVIPFGFIGVCLAHLLTGFDLTILSMIGMIGLSGIVINDSIILMVAIRDHEGDGTPFRDVLVDACCSRLRAVLLTSLTTIGGLLPICFETSLQAQFLIPVALTIVAGLATVTFLVLCLVPAMLLIGRDVRRLVARRNDGYETPAEAAAR